MKTSIALFHWLPRVLCILVILFISMFALDAFKPGLTFWQQLYDFSIHLIPSFVLTAFLIVAWKWELVGGVLFILIGLGLSPIVFFLNYHRNHSLWISLGIIGIITIPFIIVGILFLLSNRMKKRNLS